MTSLAKLFLLPGAEPLADACGTLGIHGIPVENHCYSWLKFWVVFLFWFLVVLVGFTQ